MSGSSLVTLHRGQFLEMLSDEMSSLVTLQMMMSDDGEFACDLTEDSF